MADFGWISSGGLLMDTTGDISLVAGYTEVQSLVISRLKASVEGWQIYTFGANLENRIGDLTSTVAVKIQRQVAQSLSDILSAGMYSVKVIIVGETAQLYVFVNNTAVVTATISATSVSITGA